MKELRKYDVPEVETLEVKIEKGFALSEENPGGNIPPTPFE